MDTLHRVLALARNDYMSLEDKYCNLSKLYAEVSNWEAVELLEVINAELYSIHKELFPEAY